MALCFVKTAITVKLTFLKTARHRFTTDFTNFVQWPWVFPHPVSMSPPCEHVPNPWACPTPWVCPTPWAWPHPVSISPPGGFVPEGLKLFAGESDRYLLPSESHQLPPLWRRPVPLSSPVTDCHQRGGRVVPDVMKSDGFTARQTPKCRRSRLHQSCRPAGLAHSAMNCTDRPWGVRALAFTAPLLSALVAELDSKMCPIEGV